MTDEQSKRFHKALGERLREMRSRADFTQMQVAEQLGVSQQVYASYEVGRLRLPIALLPDLAQLFQVSVEELLGLAGGKSKPGPAPKLQQQIEKISTLPRAKQKFVSDFIETVLQQA
ncbi:MAG: transcriptional regulator with XRE-family HTH domain [Akkermansiaceae bacterium]|jgi:transcriptional regulator with XRE-family HTH domain